MIVPMWTGDCNHTMRFCNRSTLMNEPRVLWYLDWNLCLICTMSTSQRVTITLTNVRSSVPRPWRWRCARIATHVIRNKGGRTKSHENLYGQQACSTCRCELRLRRRHSCLICTFTFTVQIQLLQAPLTFIEVYNASAKYPDRSRTHLTVNSIIISRYLTEAPTYGQHSLLQVSWHLSGDGLLYIILADLQRMNYTSHKCIFNSICATGHLGVLIKHHSQMREAPRSQDVIEPARLLITSYMHGSIELTLIHLFPSVLLQHYTVPAH